MEENIPECSPNFAADDAIEQMLEEHFVNFAVPKQEICRNFQIYTRRAFLKRFLAHYEFFQKVVNLPGDIVELGVHRGGSLMSWANFLEIRNMGDRQRQVIGFDYFRSYQESDSEDSQLNSVNAENNHTGAEISEFEAQLRDAIDIFDSDRFIPYKPRIVLVKGDIQETVPKYLQENPSLRISLLHIDVDLYAPASIGLRHLWQRVVPGGVVLIDGYGNSPWEGESRAVDEFFADQKVRINRLDWCSSPGGYILKE
ncbi:MAG: macrocin-O-methyltransferase [Coleofasciculaceae cyanobacterium SM2_1_6]|nr:macrocin-O-methyltransferase [Coleofasciculaceae cyanobacterium SM2_1_6]